VGTFVGTLDRFQYYLIASGIPAGREKNLGAVKLNAYRPLLSDTGEIRTFTLGVRVVAGSNPAAPTKA
jgi:hypothetical protein